MENSPIVLAHNHARSALIETRRSNPVAASEEHDLAAAEFATAAQGTSDSEAHRLLLLLEQHHKKLGSILKSRHENPGQAAATTDTSPTSALAASRTANAATTALRTPISESNPAIPKLSQNFRSSHRDSSNSIASNLASARGIPGTQQRRSSPASPTLSAQHVGGRIGSNTGLPKPSGSSSRHSSSTNRSAAQLTADAAHAQATSDLDQGPSEGNINLSNADAESSATSNATFRQFYNTFESLKSKLSAPLAFAGLPLISAAEPSQSVPEAAKNKAQTQKQTPSQPEPQASNDIDYSTLISRAALRAVRGGVSQPSVAESFYVVPTTGGTLSYAGILNHEQKEANRHQRHLSNISEDANDDFVDARETIPASATGSPELNRLDASVPAPLLRGRQARQSTSGSGTLKRSTIEQKQTVAGKSMEELALENQALKHLSDTLSKRLHMWEVNAQSSSAALQQSLRSLQNHPRSASPTGSAGRSDSGRGNSAAGNKGDDPSSAQRLEELEEMVRRMEKERGKQERENEKLKNVVGRYRERWEKLKEGAKSRREANSTGTGQSVPADE